MSSTYLRKTSSQIEVIITLGKGMWLLIPQSTGVLHGFVPAVLAVRVVNGRYMVVISLTWYWNVFRCYWNISYDQLFPKLENDYNVAKHCACFGLCKMSAFLLHFLATPKHWGVNSASEPLWYGHRMSLRLCHVQWSRCWPTMYTNEGTYYYHYILSYYLKP